MLVVGEIVKGRSIWPIWKLKQIPSSRCSTAQPHQNTCQHVCHLNFLLRGNTTPYWIRAWLKLPQCTFEPQKHCFTPLCIRFIKAPSLLICPDKLRVGIHEGISTSESSCLVWKKHREGLATSKTIYALLTGVDESGGWKGWGGLGGWGMGEVTPAPRPKNWKKKKKKKTKMENYAWLDYLQFVELAKNIFHFKFNE